MGKFEILDELVDKRNGYLLTSDVVASGISKPTLAVYIKDRGLERVARGIYLSEDAWPDELYLLYLQNRRICFSQETALYLHGLMEREPRQVSVTVMAGYNASHLRKKGVRVFQVKREIYEMGLSSIMTNYGNRVVVYDQERTICDIIKNKENMDIQVFQTAMKEYMQENEKQLFNLMTYAVRLNIENEVRRYTEVML